MNEREWTEKVRSSVRSKYAVLFAVFLTAELALAFIEGCIQSGKIEISFDILSLLMCIAAWVVISGASERDYWGKGLRFISGVIKAEFIINWILTVLLVLLGVLFFVYGEAAVKVTENLFERYGNLLSVPADTVIGIVGFVFIIAAVILLFYNYLHVHKEHKFVRSLKTTVDTNMDCVCEQNDVMVWMIILAVITVIELIIGVLNKAGPVKISEYACTILKYLCVFRFVLVNFGKEKKAIDRINDLQ